jgi:predicted DNA-binding transcriptional regulator AlpA
MESTGKSPSKVSAEFWTMQDIAQAYQISERQVYNLRKEPGFPKPHYSPKALRFPIARVRMFMFARFNRLSKNKKRVKQKEHNDSFAVK